jgi:hypothetical protein
LVSNLIIIRKGVSVTKNWKRVMGLSALLIEREIAQNDALKELVSVFAKLDAWKIKCAFSIILFSFIL